MTIKKRNSTIVKELNKIFPAENPNHPIAFEQDGLVKVSAENVALETFLYDGDPMTVSITIADYYECYMSDELVKYADSVNGYWEWENAGVMSLAY